MNHFTRHSPRHGSATIEFSLVGIPLIFVLISIFEISRGMWMYETVAHAVREGARYAAVHGQDCASTPNGCDVNIGTPSGSLPGIAQVIQGGGVGLNPDQLQVKVDTAEGDTILATDGFKTLTALLGDAQDFSNWSVGTAQVSAPGNDVIVTGVVPFYSALAMLWPGAGAVNFQTVNLAASSRERILY